MRPFRSLMLAALVLVPAAARAADVPVTYTVDTTALKLAISGTNLTFQLYTDGACTSLAHTQVLTVDNTNLLSVLKRSKPKNGVKPPKTTDVRATLTGVGPAAPVYLKVTGTGITPVGGACQVQGASTFGASPSGLVVKDVSGNILGPLLDSNGIVVLSDGGTPLAAYPQPAGFGQYDVFYYTSFDCTGPKLVYSSSIAGGFLPYSSAVVGTILYYPPLSPPLTTPNSFDYAPEIAANCTLPGQIFNLPDRCCCSSPACTTFAPGPYAPPFSMDISGFTPPFTASFQ